MVETQEATKTTTMENTETEMTNTPRNPRPMKMTLTTRPIPMPKNYIVGKKRTILRATCATLFASPRRPKAQ